MAFVLGVNMPQRKAWLVICRRQTQIVRLSCPKSMHSTVNPSKTGMTALSSAQINLPLARFTEP